MKFSFNDETDKALVATLVHEMALCKECFGNFLQASQEQHKNPDKKALRIKTHDAYSKFVGHLYEFYVGCIARDRKDTAPLPADKIDEIITQEARKLLRIRRVLIEEGVLPGGADLLSTFIAEVPAEFGSHFRLVRNRTAHALTERSNSQRAPNLNIFFKKYHQLMLIFFFSGQFAWSVRKVEEFDWGDIEEFNFGSNHA